MCDVRDQIAFIAEGAGMLLAMMVAEMEEEGQNETNWEKVTVNVEEYARMGDPAFRWHFRITKPMFQILCDELRHLLIESA